MNKRDVALQEAYEYREQSNVVPIAPYSPLQWQIAPLKCTDPTMLLTGSAGGGKALALDTEVPTPTGFTTMGELKVGDFVFDRFGNPTEIVAITNTLYDRPCYKVTFSTGESIVADAQHLWIVEDLVNLQEKILNTKTLANTYRVGKNNRVKYGVRLADEVKYFDQALPIDPYVLGTLLGDGYIARSSVEFVTGDEEIKENIAAGLGNNYVLTVTEKRENCISYRVNSVRKHARLRSRAKGWYVRKHTQSGGYMGFVRQPGGEYLYVGYTKSDKTTLEKICENYPGSRYSNEELEGSEFFDALSDMGLVGTKSSTKFIPNIYKIASVESRLALLQGLMDTDGSIDKKRGRVEFTSISKTLAEDVHELCCSLGIKSHLAERTVRLADKIYIAWRVQFTSDKNVFRLRRKANFVKTGFRKTQNQRYIVDITSVNSVPVKCIQVDSVDGSYLATRSYIVTHNSRLAAEKIHLYLKKYPGSMGLMVRKQRNSMVNSTVLFMERTIIGNDPTVKHFPSKNRFEYDNGSILAYGGMDGEEQKQQIRSIGQAGALHIAWMEEANAFQEDDFNELIARMRGTGVPWRQIILSTNPDAPTHWIYQRLILNQEATTFYSNAALNTYNPDDYVDTLNTLTGVAKLRLAEGRWVQASGVIYDEWDYDTHTCEPFDIPPSWVRVLSVDFGYVNPFVTLWGALDEDNRLYIYKEHYKSKLTVTKHAEVINRELEKESIFPDVVICDHDSEDRQTLAEHGLPNIPANKEVETGIGLVKDRLKVQGDGKPRLMVFRNSLLEVDPEMKNKKKPTRLVEELPGYVWTTTKDTQNPKEVPLKFNDHACFVAGTKVTTDKGEFPIETIGIGTNVLTRKGWRKVIAAGKTANYARVMEVQLTDGKRLTGTPTHPIHSGEKWVPMCELYVGDPVTVLENEDGVDNPTVSWIQHYMQWQAVYNITVEDVPEYYANGILVHNCDALRYMVMFVDFMEAGMDHA